MNIATHLCFASLAFAAAVQAQPVQNASTPVIAPSPVVVAAHSPTTRTISTLREFQGQHRLHDGRTLTVSLRGHRLYVDIAGQDRVELVAVSPAAFVTKSGATRVTFQQAANGNVFGVELIEGGGNCA